MGGGAKYWKGNNLLTNAVKKKCLTLGVLRESRGDLRAAILDCAGYGRPGRGSRAHDDCGFLISALANFQGSGGVRASRRGGLHTRILIKSIITHLKCVINNKVRNIWCPIFLGRTAIRLKTAARAKILDHLIKQVCSCVYWHVMVH